ncbi:MAG: hypothetical protein ABIP35_15690 [Ginsengibacter sp.]
MKFLAKKHTLIFIIILLLITNFVLSALFIFKNPHPDRKSADRENKGRMYMTLQKEVGFSEAQLKDYQELRKEQFQNLKPLFNNVRNSKETFYQFLYDQNVPDSLVNNAADSIGYNQKMLDLQMLSFFKKIRRTCTEEQLPKFDSTIKRSIQRITGMPGKSDPK